MLSNHLLNSFSDILFNSLPSFHFAFEAHNGFNTSIVLPNPLPPGGSKRNYGFSGKVIAFHKSIYNSRRYIPPYCVSKLIQIFPQCYRFYIYRKCSKINTFRNGRCTHTWAAIVLFFRIAALLIVGSVKFNDNLFFSKAIVIFCTQRILLFYHSILPC